MSRSRPNKSHIALGVILILVGALFLSRLFVPSLQHWFDAAFEWPMIIIVVGVCLLLFGLLVGAPGMAIPAAIVAGIGGILYWQNLTADWESWAFLWTLIPGFVGVGTIIAGLFGKYPSQSLRSGFSLILISLLLFAIFSSLLGGPVSLGQYWPVLLILLGLWILIRNLFRPR